MSPSSCFLDTHITIRILSLSFQVEENEAELQHRGDMMDTVAEKKSDLLDQLTLVKTQYDAATLSLSQKQSQVRRGGTFC